MVKVQVVNSVPMHHFLNEDNSIGLTKHIQKCMGGSLGEYLVSNAVELGLDWGMSENPIYDAKEFFLRVNVLNNEEINKLKEGLHILYTSGLMDNPEVKMACALISSVLKDREIKANE